MQEVYHGAQPITKRETASATMVYVPNTKGVLRRRAPRSSTFSAVRARVGLSPVSRRIRPMKRYRSVIGC